MDELTSRFIGAYNEIHRFLRNLCKAGSDAQFSVVLRQAAKSNSTVHAYERELIELNELRNAIIHRYEYEEPIATPCLSVVKRLEAIRDVFQSPPSLGTLFRTAVATCATDTPIVQAAKKMGECSFSQLPVYKDSSLVALLTTNTIARWFAARFVSDGGIVDETQVESVLQHAEAPDNYTLMDPFDTVFDAIDCFLSRQKQGKRCDAILITQGGKKTAKPIGIITAVDVPRLYEAMK